MCLHSIISKQLFVKSSSGYSILNHQDNCGVAFTPVAAMTHEDVQQLAFLERQAQQQWHLNGHPGWRFLSEHEWFPSAQPPFLHVWAHHNPETVKFVKWRLQALTNGSNFCFD